MRLLCVAATASEFSALFPRRGRRREPAEHEALPLPGGRLACITGVGPVNAAAALGRILALHRGIEAVLVLGLAGSFDPARAPLASSTLVTEEIWPEYGLSGPGGVDARALGFALWRGPDGPIFDRLPLHTDLRAFGLPAQEDALPGKALTVAGVTASPERAALLAGRYAPLSENMEGFAVALACARAGVPCAELRVISNRVAPRGEEDRDFAGALAKLGAIGQNLFDR
jgi:futalosine hydrolase